MLTQHQPLLKTLADHFDDEQPISVVILSTSSVDLHREFIRQNGGFSLNFDDFLELKGVRIEVIDGTSFRYFRAMRLVLFEGKRVLFEGVDAGQLMECRMPVPDPELSKYFAEWWDTTKDKEKVDDGRPERMDASKRGGACGEEGAGGP